MMRLLADLVLVLSANPGRTLTETGLMMARVRPSGLFELLSADAWGRALGYAPDELCGKSLRELIGKPGSGRIVRALLDHEDAGPLEVTLRCKDQQRKRFRFHRRFDSYQDTTYLVVDELSESRV